MDLMRGGTHESPLDLKQFGQLGQRSNRDHRLLRLALRIANTRIQHPGGQRALGLIGQLNDDFIRAKAVVTSNDSDFLPTERMETIFNPSD